jgi:hypothetical protein
MLGGISPESASWTDWLGTNPNVLVAATLASGSQQKQQAERLLNKMIDERMADG